MKQVIEFFLVVESACAIWLYLIGPLQGMTPESILFSAGATVVFYYVLNWVGGIWRMTR